MDDPADRRQGHRSPEEGPASAFDETGEEQFDDIDDLLAVWADDELLDVLGGADPDAVLPCSACSVDTQLVDLLWSFRRDVDAEPVDDAADEEHHDADIATQAPARYPRHLFMRPLASAAAVLLVLLAGVGMAAHGARPDDPLWTVTKILYTDHAESVQAEQQVQRGLDAAAAAAAAGRRDDARAALNTADSELPRVRPEDGKQELQARQQQVVNELQRAAAQLTQKPPAPEATARSSATEPAGPGPTQPSKDLRALQPPVPEPPEEPRQEPGMTPSASAPPSATQPSRDDASPSRAADPPTTWAGSTRAAEEYPPADPRSAQRSAATSPPPKAPEPTTRRSVAPEPTAGAGLEQRQTRDPGIGKREPAPQQDKTQKGTAPSADRTDSASGGTNSGSTGSANPGPTARARTQTDRGAQAGQPGAQQPDQKSAAGRGNAPDPKNVSGQDGSAGRSRGTGG